MGTCIWYVLRQPGKNGHRKNKTDPEQD
ncbi:uncharacterized protein G2W53_006806 [Senna tora]|uniref:Uncharacterized protein n=1 Tax=Senna tora TaxID=362788 RepID=A0A834X5S1_9FABA|nr:uncharacterized protein G2W53_006806 [Senna tora]